MSTFNLNCGWEKSDHELVGERKRGRPHKAALDVQGDPFETVLVLGSVEDGD